MLPDFTPDEIAAGHALKEHLRAKRLAREAAEADARREESRRPWWRDPMTFLRRTRQNRWAATHRVAPLENGVRDPWTGRGAA